VTSKEVVGMARIVGEVMTCDVVEARR